MSIPKWFFIYDFSLFNVSKRKSESKVQKLDRLLYAFPQYGHGNRDNMGFALAGKDVSFNNSNVKFVIIHKN